MIAVIACVMTSGCAALNDNHYFAANLPGVLQASANPNPQLIDFSNLSGGASNSEIIGNGDVLEVSLVASLNSRDIQNYTVRVGEDGNSELPWIGTVRLAGLHPFDAEAVITQAGIQSGQFRSPHVTVTIKKRKTKRVLVVGAVRSPGWKNVPANESDLLSILFHAGGLADDAGMFVEIKNVVSREEAMTPAIATGNDSDSVTRTGYSTASSTPRSVRIDLISAARDGTSEYFVGDHGVVMVEKRDPESIHVLGLVRKSGRQDFPLDDAEFRLLDAIAQAGYTSSQVADKVFVVRRDPSDGKPVVIQASLKKARHHDSHNLILAPGDVVTVEHTISTVVLELLQMIRVGASVNPFI